MLNPKARPFSNNTKLLFSSPPYFPLPLPPPSVIHAPVVHHFVPLQYPIMKPFSYFLQPPPQPILESHTTTIITTTTTTNNVVTYKGSKPFGVSSGRDKSKVEFGSCRGRRRGGFFRQNQKRNTNRHGFIWRAKTVMKEGLVEGEETKRSQTQSSPYDFIENDDESEVDGRTSVMVKNIPSKLSRTKLIELLDIHCDKENKKVDEQYSESCQEISEFDFVYLPMDFRTGLNLGYAFVNFTRFVGAVRFFRYYHNFAWKSFDSNKVCEIKLARVQGKQGLVRHFENSYFRCDTDEYLPVVFSPARDGSLSSALPAIIGRRKKKSSSVGLNSVRD